MKSKHILAHILAFSTTVVWGLTFISTKVLLDTHTPLEIIVYRFSVAILALFAIRPYFFRHNQGWRMELMFAGAGFSGIALYFIFENMALDYTYASNVSLIICTAPFLTGIAARIFLGEQLQGSFFIGFIVAITGIAMISFSGATELNLNPRGDLLAVLAAASWAMYSILIRKIFRCGFPLLEATRRILIWGLISLILFLPLQERVQLLPELNLIVFGNIFFLGLIASSICFVTWNFALRQLGAVSATAYVYLTPVVTVLGAVIILSEQITTTSGLGMLLTLLGLILSERHSFLSAKNADS